MFGFEQDLYPEQERVSRGDLPQPLIKEGNYFFIFWHGFHGFRGCFFIFFDTDFTDYTVFWGCGIGASVFAATKYPAGEIIRRSEIIAWTHLYRILSKLVIPILPQRATMEIVFCLD